MLSKSLGISGVEVFDIKMNKINDLEYNYNMTLRSSIIMMIRQI